MLTFFFICFTIFFYTCIHNNTSTRYGATLPLILECAFSKRKTSHLYNHATMIKIRIWILIHYCFISSDLHKILGNTIKFFNPHVFPSPEKNIFDPRFDPESHLDLVALSLYKVSLVWNRFSSPFHDLKIFDKCRLFVLPLYLSEASSWLGLGYTYFQEYHRSDIVFMVS